MNSEKKADRKIVYIEYREYCAFPDAEISDLLKQYGIDPNKPHDITYSQVMRRYEVSQGLKHILF